MPTIENIPGPMYTLPQVSSRPAITKARSEDLIVNPLPQHSSFSYNDRPSIYHSLNTPLHLLTISKPSPQCGLARISTSETDLKSTLIGDTQVSVFSSGFMMFIVVDT